jgi:hypothetical protein
MNLNNNTSMLDQIIELMDENVINQRINEPLNVAYNCFWFPDNGDVTHKKFNSVLAEFYLHLNRSSTTVREFSRDEGLQEMMWFLERHYRSEKAVGYKAVYLDVICEDYEEVFERIVELMKSIEKEKYVNWILTTCIDPLDWDCKKRLVEEIQKRFGYLFPPDMQDMAIGELIIDLEMVISNILNSQLCF